MRYDKTITAEFIRRPNRFIAICSVNGRETVCHVKNTGRCRELLTEGAEVILVPCAADSKRKTKYDLVAVCKNGMLINMDSYAPNLAAGEWIAAGGLGKAENIRPEYTYGDSRFDFFAVIDGRTSFIEVKGVTLEENGVVMFPDAPTERGLKHINGLIRCAAEGHRACLLLVVQMSGSAEYPLKYFTPNRNTDPKLAEAMKKASESGVEIICRSCRVTPDSMDIDAPVKIIL